MRRFRLSVLVLALLGLLVPTPAAVAAPRVLAPGSFTGFAFDACATPDQAAMDAWLQSSPYWAVGVYLGGSNRYYCGPEGTTDALTADWVATQSRRGWRILPLWVGPQASCTGYADVIDPTNRDGYAPARAQGRAAASQAVTAARALGIGAGSTLWYDLEDFDLQASDDCRRSALSFLSAWTKGLHALHYVSGVYANVAAGVHALDYADEVSPRAYAEPDQIWYAWANGRADTAIDTKWVRRSSWQPHRRVHQYRHDVRRTYGGVSLTVDENFLDVGRGSVAGRPAASCGVRVSFPSYGVLRRGSKGAHVRAAQCLLRQQGFYRGKVNGRFDLATVRATRRLQRARDLPVSGRMTRPAWTSLLASGGSPLLKWGSAGEKVRRVQRALNAARGDRLAVTGVFTGPTTRSVRRYQRAVGLPASGVVTAQTWAALHAGRR
jgi:hypothetical protein